MSKLLEFYQLERSPFEDGVRDAAAVGTRPLRAALDRARRFIEAETAVVCVKGRSGIGKTYFGLALPSVLPAGTLIARIGQPAQPWSTLHVAIAKSFDLDPHSFSVDALHDLRDTDRRLVIVIDPVEQLQLDAVTPLLSLLSHAYLPERRLVQAVLIGDFAGLPVAAHEGLAALGTACLELEALPDCDVPSYLHKRLDRAGYRGKPLFSRAACEEIRRRADGVPREINRICTLALELAATRRKQIIEPDVIRDAYTAPSPDAPPATAPAQDPAPGAAPPRAVIGRLKLKTRSVPPGGPALAPAGRAPSGQVRRIEPLPPEPVVEAEQETPLMDAEFVDDEPTGPPTDLRVHLEAPAPVGTPIQVSVQVPESIPVQLSVPQPASTTLESRPEPTAPEPAPAPLRRERAFPWIHVAASLAVAWALAAGLFWLYEHRREPDRAPEPPAAPAVGKPEPSPFSATALQTEPEAELASLAPSPGVPPPTQTALVQTPAATPTPQAPAAAAPAQRKAPVAPPRPPLRVELRSRGREILYPSHPPSAYLAPAQ